jgi:hypothetical protein
MLLTTRGMGCILLLAALSIPFATLAHNAPSGWAYPYECCSDKDCEVLPLERVTVEPDGYHLPNGAVVAHNKIRYSPDGRYHWCRYGGTGSLIRPSGQQVCLWVPGGGT